MRVMVLFDIPDDLIKARVQTQEYKDLFHLAISAWMEFNVPHRGMGGHCRACVFDRHITSRLGNDLNQHQYDDLYNQISEIYEFVDKYLSRVFNPMQLIMLDRINWMNSSCLINADAW